MENWFSDYEAFALLNGVRLMGHGWPQGLAVSVMRRVRPGLEEEHRKILRQNSKWLLSTPAVRRVTNQGVPFAPIRVSFAHRLTRNAHTA